MKMPRRSSTAQLVRLRARLLARLLSQPGSRDSEKEWTSPRFTVIERTQVVSGENERNSAVTLLSSDNKELCNLVSNWAQDLDGPQKLRIYIRDR